MQVPAKALAVSLAFLAGVGVGIGGYRIHVLDQAAAESKDRWLICTKAHQPALYDRADLYRQKLGRWPTNVQELVEAHFLPEYSEVHLCPSQVNRLTRTHYEGSGFIDQNHTGCVAYYTSSPYRFLVEGSNFTVVCGFEMGNRQ